MNRRNFFTWIAAAIGWLGIGKVTPTNCFVTYHGTVDCKAKPSGRFATYKEARDSGADAIIEYGPQAWTAKDLSTLSAICLTCPGARLVTVRSLDFKYMLDTPLDPTALQAASDRLLRPSITDQQQTAVREGFIQHWKGPSA